MCGSLRVAVCGTESSASGTPSAKTSEAEAPSCCECPDDAWTQAGAQNDVLKRSNDLSRPLPCWPGCCAPSRPPAGKLSAPVLVATVCSSGQRRDVGRDWRCQPVCQTPSVGRPSAAAPGSVPLPAVRWTSAHCHAATARSQVRQHGSSARCATACARADAGRLMKLIAVSAPRAGTRLCRNLQPTAVLVPHCHLQVALTRPAG